jgi:thiamine-phosphate pyrophosphorylase
VGTPDFEQARERIGLARLMLIFSPELCGEREPLEVLSAALPAVDVVQVRIKRPGEVEGPSPARALLDWTRRVLARVREERGEEVPVIVNDRVDVARVLLEEGCAGVHLGDRDCPVDVARELLGYAPLLGLSTHGSFRVSLAGHLPVDYLGFGPVYPTATRGHAKGLGPEAAWVAHSATTRPLFAIGGIDSVNVLELLPVGRVAVSSAILGAGDPGAAAREIREVLESGESD